jgi:hypothetical protein
MVLRTYFQTGGLSFIRPGTVSSQIETYLTQAEACSNKLGFCAKHFQATAFLVAAVVTSFFSAASYGAKALAEPILFYDRKRFTSNAVNAKRCLMLTVIVSFLAIGALFKPGYCLSLVQRQPDTSTDEEMARRLQSQEIRLGDPSLEAGSRIEELQTQIADLQTALDKAKEYRENVDKTVEDLKRQLGQARESLAAQQTKHEDTMSALTKQGEDLQKTWEIRWAELIRRIKLAAGYDGERAPENPTEQQKNFMQILQWLPNILEIVPLHQ